MTLFQAIVLAVIQGLTEFLPISSSAHLILIPKLTGWTDQSQTFDIAVHFGTLLAIMIYFRQEIFLLMRQFIRAPLMRHTNPTTNQEAKLGWCIILATLPIVIAGVLLDDIIEQHFREMWIIGIASITFGLLLLWSEKSATAKYDWTQITWKIAIIIGLAQILALIPGTSRSGITITAGLLVGLKITDAAKFSFLLSIPTILGAAILALKKILADQLAPVDWTPILIGISVSGISAYLCIDLFMRFVQRVGMLPFVAYRVALGALLLGLHLHATL